MLIAQVHACDREPQNRSRARLLGPPLGQSKTRSKIFRSIKCLYQRLAERESAKQVFTRVLCRSPLFPKVLQIGRLHVVQGCPHSFQSVLNRVIFGDPIGDHEGGDRWLPS